MHIQDFRIPSAHVAGYDPIEKPWESTKAALSAYVSCAPELRSQFLKELTPGQRAVIAIGAVRGEVDNGGFTQFFFNSSCAVVAEAIEGMRLIGAKAHAKLVETAWKASGLSEADLLDHEKRRAKLEKMVGEKFSLRMTKNSMN